LHFASLPGRKLFFDDSCMHSIVAKATIDKAKKRIFLKLPEIGDFVNVPANESPEPALAPER
jgi:hypothetical protein